jgi:hypothetical protein
MEAATNSVAMMHRMLEEAFDLSKDIFRANLDSVAGIHVEVSPPGYYGFAFVNQADELSVFVEVDDEDKFEDIDLSVERDSTWLHILVKFHEGKEMPTLVDKLVQQPFSKKATRIIQSGIDRISMMFEDDV